MISVIIPYYENFPEKKKILQECVRSLKGHDEVIVVWNDRMGYAPAINRGCNVANGDYFIIMNDDVSLNSGDLKNLCIPGYVTSPLNGDKSYDYIWGSCFCIPANIWNLIGGMDERYDISYFDDDDLIFTLIKNNIPFKSVKNVVFNHPKPGTTLENMPDRNEFFQENRRKFKEKWGRLP